jgi:hypothetical protein
MVTVKNPKVGQTKKTKMQEEETSNNKVSKQSKKFGM